MSRDKKECRLDWIQEIPSDWEIGRLKNIFSFGKGLPITKDDLKQQGIPVISYGQIHSKVNTGVGLSDGLFRYVDKNYLHTNLSSLVHKGDFIFADTSEDYDGCGNCVYVDKEQSLFAGYHTIILTSKDAADNRYLAYLFKTDAWRSQIRSKVFGIKVYSVTKKILSETSILCPPKECQKKIADFLDRKCTEIDAVREHTRSTIDEYKKLKQAVITEAVTKGVRGQRSMKDSGVEWIGMIPADWQVFRVANLYREVSDKGNDELPILTVSINSGVSDRELSDEESERVFVRSEDRSKYKRVQPGDLTYNMMRAWQGAFGAVRVDGMVSPAYVVARPMKQLDSRYVEYLFRTPEAIEEMHRYSYGVADFRLRLYWPQFRNIKMCVPPAEEQAEIADYIDAKSAEIDTLIAKKEQYLVELENYKKSLIYEYVTGKKEVPANEF